jgi:competence protein ComEC
MAWMPTSVLEPGFQLSFAAVAAIFLAVPRVRTALEGYPVPPAVSDALVVALACGVVTAPILLFHFGQVPVYTVLANVVAFAAAPVVLGLGLLAAVADPVSPDVAAGLASLAGWAAAWLELVARTVAGLPNAQVGARASAYLVVGAAGCWLAFGQLRKRLRVRGPVVLAVGIVGLATGSAWVAVRPAPAWDQPAGLRVTFLDVGQGDSVLLETPKARLLIDEGPPEADVAGQLRGMGVRSLSAIVLTHPQRDHIGGAADVIRRLRVAQVFDPGLEASGPEYEDAIAAAQTRGTAVRVVRAGEAFHLGRLVVRVLWPADAGRPDEDPNLNAVVLLASFGATDVFLSADAESDVTSTLPLEEVEIMKVAHHGSEDPGLGDELRDLRPRIAVISCGRGNDYGHPRPGTLAALAGAPGVTVYRTDEDGRVVIETDGRGFRVQTSR